MKTVYFISRVDDAMFLVLLIEGTRRPNEKIAQVTRMLEVEGSQVFQVLTTLL